MIREQRWLAISIVLTWLSCWFTSNAFAQRIYVDFDATGNNDGSARHLPNSLA